MRKQESIPLLWNNPDTYLAGVGQAWAQGKPLLSGVAVGMVLQLQVMNLMV